MKIQVKVSRQENCEYFGVKKDDIVSLPLEQYVSGVVASEIGNSPLEACKAQAIAARTFAWNYLKKDQAISDQSSVAQAFRASRMNNVYYQNAKEGAEQTAGILLYYQGQVISTCSYSASNGGRTVSSEERWGGVRPWQIAQDDPWDLAATGGKKAGHGVGMSQKGAVYAAKIGKDCEEILRFYYHGCTMKRAEGITMENAKTEAVRKWAQKRIGNPYVYGGTGKTCTVSYRNQQASQYPESASQIKKNCQRMSKGKNSCSGCPWYDEEKQQGKQCYDCAQFVRWGMKEAGLNFPSGATSQWRKVEWERTGSIETLPDTLCLVYRQDKDGTMGHTGIYLGDGMVADARGSNYGVLHETQEAYGRWTHWGIPAGQYTQISEEYTMIATVAGGNLNMRQAKSKGSERICQIPDGTEVGVIEKGEDWCRVAYGEHTGYVMTKYLSFEQISEEGEYDVVIRCSTVEEKEMLLKQLHGAISNE